MESIQQWSYHVLSMLCLLGNCQSSSYAEFLSCIAEELILLLCLFVVVFLLWNFFFSYWTMKQHHGRLISCFYIWPSCQPVIFIRSWPSCRGLKIPALNQQVLWSLKTFYIPSKCSLRMQKLSLKSVWRGPVSVNMFTKIFFKKLRLAGGHVLTSMFILWLDFKVQVYLKSWDAKCFIHQIDVEISMPSESSQGTESSDWERKVSWLQVIGNVAWLPASPSSACMSPWA